MKISFRLPTAILAATISLSTVFGAIAQEATPAASPVADLGTPVPTLECWSDAPDSSVAGYPQWAGVPEMKIDTSKTYYATVETNRGTFVIELNDEAAPNTVNNFVCLATNHYYDGVIFHRVIRDFMIQTGDPTGTGRGGPGYQINDELPGDDMNYLQGTVAMANAGPNTGGSQFFINTVNNAGQLGKTYTIFGTVIEGMDVVQLISEVPVGFNASGEQSVPAATMTVLRITITAK